MRLREIVIGVKLGALLPAAAQAHVSEQGFVLLLPTEVYTAAGVAAVTLTVLALFALPGGAVRGSLRTARLHRDTSSARSK
ncbi:hypothetical protein ACFQFQ_10150 [Sulfitobacter porphyrae]|uniref:Uncharacterized protein n=1 Tax=Sulfitobacter porphyrae TaxID=1246864 RepID=A0ABW2B3N9_9RHOB